MSDRHKHPKDGGPSRLCFLTLWPADLSFLADISVPINPTHAEPSWPEWSLKYPDSQRPGLWGRPKEAMPGVKSSYT